MIRRGVNWGIAIHDSWRKMRLFLRSGAGFGAVIALALGIVLTAAPAQSAQHNLKSVDITGYKVSDIVVSNKKCYDHKITAAIKKKTKTVTSFSSTVNLVRKGKVLNDGIVDLRDLSDRIYFCPSARGLGKYTIGPASSFAEYTYKREGTTYEPGIFYQDNTKKNFYVRGVVKSNLSAKRKGTKVTISTTASMYAPEKGRYAQYNPKNAKLQVKSGKIWKTIKTLNLKSGKASVTLKNSKKKTYRVTIPKSSYAVAKTSNSVSK